MYANVLRPLGALVTAAVTLAGLAACQSHPPHEPTAVAASQPAPPPPEPVAPPRSAEPAPAPAVSSESHALPDYLHVLERYRVDELAHVEAQITSRERLVITTRNVRRLRIDRDRLPMDTRGSIVLRLDGQGIEWPADSTTVEFERSINGAWEPARSQKPGP